MNSRRAFTSYTFGSLLIGEDERLYMVGSNTYGQLGRGDKEDINTFEPVLLPPNIEIKSVAAGTCHMIILTTDGRVFVWGRNEFGQLGLGM
jgi:alpha-tubulin suppressor-like RCC1 family protein